MVLGRSVPTLSSVSLTFRPCRFETVDQIELQAIEVRLLLPSLWVWTATLSEGILSQREILLTAA
jgi:hypothetical protein